MYTQCENCHTYFRVSEEQLELANGMVRCGRCDHVFNALNTLTHEVPGAIEESDEIKDGLLSDIENALADSESLSASADTDDDFDLGNFDLEESAPLTVKEQASGGDLDDSLLDDLEKFDISEDVVSTQQTVEEQKTPPATFTEPEPAQRSEVVFDLDEGMETQAIDDIDTAPDTMTGFDMENEPPTEVIEETEFEEEEREETRRKSRDSRERRRVVAEELKQAEKEVGGSPVATTVWSLVIVALMAVLVGQFAYFKRDELIKYPSLKPVLMSMCDLLKCDLPMPRDLDKLAMTEREVRSHPNMGNALLITAEIENNAEYTQAYPNLELAFSDINQKLLARRTFTPEQYLGEGVKPDQGMPAKVPVKIVLEIVDPGPEAVNFAFNFR